MWCISTVKSAWRMQMAWQLFWRHDICKDHDDHYTDVIMTTMASQITSLTVVYSTVYSDADQRKHQSSASLAFVWGNHRDRWIPRTKGQLRGKCFHLMTSSCDSQSWDISIASVNNVQVFTVHPCWRHIMGIFPYYWSFLRGIHRSLVVFLHEGQQWVALIYSLMHKIHAYVLRSLCYGSIWAKAHTLVFLIRTMYG